MIVEVEMTVRVKATVSVTEDDSKSVRDIRNQAVNAAAELLAGLEVEDPETSLGIADVSRPSITRVNIRA